MWARRALLRSESFASLAAQRAVKLPALLGTDTAERMARAVLAAESRWTRDFGGDQFSVGLAWYTHLETGRARHYFRDAGKANALVEAVLPGMQAGVIALVSDFVGAPVAARAGWCGPGIHVFPPDGPVAERGGTVHFDVEGLVDQPPAAPALSLVVMLDPAGEGGGLRLWPARYSGEAHPKPEEAAADPETLDYAAGDALFFESYRLHQITAFASDRPRISITAHAVRGSAGWVVWF